MVRDLDVPVEIRVCPIMREPDGLAMSSRNVYLDAEQRQNARALFRSLEAVRTRMEAGERNVESLIRLARGMIERTPGTKIDYVSFVDYERLQPLERLQGDVLIALAVFFGTTRLIDNMLIRDLSTWY
jgi:pantoate--beta-alanine ligase